MAREPKKFLITYHSSASAMKKMQTATPEEMQQGMDAWMAWAEKCGEQLIEMGAPLMGSVNLKDGGEWLPSKRKITGYSIVKAPTIAGAKRLVKAHPHLKWAKGCEIEVHEMMKM